MCGRLPACDVIAQNVRVHGLSQRVCSLNELRIGSGGIGGKKLGEPGISMIALQRVGYGMKQGAGSKAPFFTRRTTGTVHRHGKGSVEQARQNVAGEFLVERGQRGWIGRQGAHGLGSGQALVHAALMALQLVQLEFKCL